MMELVECGNIVDAMDVGVTKYCDAFEASCLVFLIPTDFVTLVRRTIYCYEKDMVLNKASMTQLNNKFASDITFTLDTCII